MAVRNPTAFGMLYATTGGTTALTTSTGAWAALANAGTNSRGMVLDPTTAFSITVGMPGDYRITFGANILASSGTPTVLLFTVYRNSTALAVMKSKGAAASAPTQVTHSGIWPLLSGDVITVTALSATGNETVTVNDATLLVEGVN